MPGHYNDKTMMMMNQKLADPMIGRSLGTTLGSPTDPGTALRQAEIEAIAGDRNLPPLPPMMGGAPMPPMMQNEAMPDRTRAPMSDVDKVQMLMDMGLTQDEAIEAVVIEKSMPPVMPQEFGGARQAPPMGMGALGGVPMGGQAPMPMPTPRPQMPMDMGADRTMNPMDRLTPRNVPST